MASVVRASVAGVTYFKDQDPNIWVFESIAGMRAFAGPRSATEGATAFAAVAASTDCTPTVSLWMWDDECTGADDGDTIVMPTDHPLSGGSPVAGRWIKVWDSEDGGGEPEEPLDCAGEDGDGLRSGPLDQAVYVPEAAAIFGVRGGFVYKFDADTGEMLAARRFTNLSGAQSCICFCPTDGTLWCGAWQGRNWDSMDLTLPGYVDPWDGKEIYRIGPTAELLEEGRVEWPLDTDPCITLYPYYSGGVYSLHFSEATGEPRMYAIMGVGDVHENPYVFVWNPFDYTYEAYWDYPEWASPVCTDICTVGDRIWVLSSYYYEAWELDPTDINSPGCPFGFWDTGGGFELDTNSGYGMCYVAGEDAFYYALYDRYVVKQPRDGSASTLIDVGVDDSIVQRVRYDETNNRVFTANGPSDSVSWFTPGGTVYTRRGFDMPVDIVFTGTKAFAVQAGEKGLKEIDVDNPDLLYDPALIAAFTTVPDPAPLPGDVQFVNTSTGTLPFTSQWSFGDGDTSAADSPLHTYATTGSGGMEVTLTVTDGTLTQSLTRQVGYARNVRIKSFDIADWTLQLTAGSIMRVLGWDYEYSGYPQHTGILYHRGESWWGTWPSNFIMCHYLGSPFPSGGWDECPAGYYTDTLAQVSYVFFTLGGEVIDLAPDSYGRDGILKPIWCTAAMNTAGTEAMLVFAAVRRDPYWFLLVGIAGRGGSSAPYGDMYGGPSIFWIGKKDFVTTEALETPDGVYTRLDSSVYPHYEDFAPGAVEFSPADPGLPATIELEYY